MVWKGTNHSIFDLIRPARARPQPRFLHCFVCLIFPHSGRNPDQKMEETEIINKKKINRCRDGLGNLWVLCKVLRLFDGIQKPHMKIDLWEGCECAEIPRKGEKSIGFQAEGREREGFWCRPEPCWGRTNGKWRVVTCSTWGSNLVEA